MTADRWPMIERLCHEALARPAEDRPAFLSTACGGDDALRHEVESLLAHDGDASFLSTPAAMFGDDRALHIGQTLGSYVVSARLGEGGMGEVYRARDTTLGRDVAIKVLPAVFASDPERLARFTREARMLAALNHPHIGAIHGVEERDGIRALVLELVEGPTPADRLAKGPLAITEALPIAKQIADALEAAHEKGIVHRDLKPANIKITPDGVVKVLDFGLAKAAAGDGAASQDVSQSPTVTVSGTREGVILGTAAYMSPEQARGQAVDRRTDIWAFGCVLYEMLAGRAAFSGATITDTLAAILEREPDWRLLSAGTPAAVCRLLRRCLRKDPSDRLHSMADARIEIQEAISEPADQTSRVRDRPQSSGLWRAATAAAAAMVGGILIGTMVWLWMRPSPSHVKRTMITPSLTASLKMTGTDRSLAIAPDGTRVVYVNTLGKQIFVRLMDQLEPTAFTTADLPYNPFFSPDGQWIGFFEGNGVLKKMAITGGAAVTLASLDGNKGRGATWADDGTIVFATSGPSGLEGILSSGGRPTVLTTPNRNLGEADHLWPEFLPGGRAVLFTITSTTGRIENAQVAVLDLRSGRQKVLLRGGSYARYVPSGHLVYAAGGTLRALPFDLDRLEVSAMPAVVALPQVVTTVSGAAAFDFARDGTLVYVPGGILSDLEGTLVWVDRKGHEEPIKAPPRSYLYPRLSSDGTRVALDIRDQDYDIWMWDVAHETLTRVTADSALDRFPLWMPDGRLLFRSERPPGPGLFVQSADGTNQIERIESSPNRVPQSISPDGAWLVVREDASTSSDLMMMSLGKDHRLLPLVQTPFDELNGQISPNGHWLAYQANDSGRFEIYVRPFPDVNRQRWQISTNGGIQPLWAPNGLELFYVEEGGAVMNVPVRSGTHWVAGAPTPLFQDRYVRGSAGAAPTYDVSRDGRRFLMIKPAEFTPGSLIVVQNWFEELKHLVPTK